MRNRLRRSPGVALLGIGLTTGGAAVAQEIETDEIIATRAWNDASAEIYADGWSAEGLIDEAVVISSVTGEEIGNAENILISPEGRILSIIAEVGGVWDIGDTHVNIPWNQVELAEDLGSIAAPITEENVDDYGLYGTYGYYGEEAFITAEQATEEIEVVEEDLATGPRTWRASELIDDYARLADGVAYGYVDDLIFSQAGQLEAVIVEPDLAYGTESHAASWDGYPYGWDPGLDYFTLPYAEEEIGELDTFEDEAMEPLQDDYGVIEGMEDFEFGEEEFTDEELADEDEGLFE